MRIGVEFTDGEWKQYLDIDGYKFIQDPSFLVAEGKDGTVYIQTDVIKKMKVID